VACGDSADLLIVPAAPAHNGLRPCGGRAQPGATTPARDRPFLTATANIERCDAAGNKREFIDATFDRLGGVLQGGVKLEVEHLHVDGDTTIAELLSTSTTNEGASFDNHYC